VSSAGCLLSEGETGFSIERTLPNGARGGQIFAATVSNDASFSTGLPFKSPAAESVDSISVIRGAAEASEAFSRA